MTPDDWMDLAAKTDRQALDAARAGDTSRAATLGLQAERYRQAAQEAAKLSPVRRRGKPETGMVNAARVRHSEAMADDPLVAAANAAHFTLRSLAEAVGCSHALLSKARKGERSIDARVAAEIERLIGFKATREHWPKLRQ